MQTIHFYGAGIHNHNDIVERDIQDITKDTRTLLLHIKRHWTDAVGTILWPFALKAGKDRKNHLKIDINGPQVLTISTQILTLNHGTHRIVHISFSTAVYKEYISLNVILKLALEFIWDTPHVTLTQSYQYLIQLLFMCPLNFTSLSIKNYPQCYF